MYAVCFSTTHTVILHRDLKRYVLAPLVLVLCTLLLVALFALDRVHQHRVSKDIRSTQQFFETRFEREIELDAGHLAALIDVLQNDPRLLDALARRDRAGLLARTTTLYQRLKSEHSVTAFSFIGPDRVALLRLHDPNRDGDAIGRTTLLRAESVQQRVSGIEMGYLGQISLRVAQPIWEPGGRLLGYVELGQDIGHAIKSKSLAERVEVHVLIDKHLLSRPLWERGEQDVGRTPDWDRFADVVLTHSSAALPAGLIDDASIARASTLQDTRHAPLPARGATLHPVFLPLHDAGGQRLGALLLAIDLSPIVASSRWASWLLIGIGLPLSLALLLLLHQLLTMAQVRLQTEQAERDALTQQHLTELRQHEAALSASEARLKEAQRLAQLGHWDLDWTINHLHWSDQIYRIFEIDPARFGATYEAFLDAIHPEDRVLVARTYQASVDQRAPYEVEHRLLMPDGRIKHVHERGETHYDAQGRPVRAIGTVQDITRAKQAQEQLRWLAHHDSLTNLPNRVLLQDRLHQAMEQASQQRTRLALLVLGLDKFKHINNSLGHLAGDEVLIQTSARLRERLGPSVTLARMGGDEFALVLAPMERPEDAAALAEDLIGLLHTVIVLHSGHAVHVGASVGMALYPEHGSDVTSLLKNAEAALHLAKHSGGNTLHFYTDELARAADERLAMEAGLRRALEQGEFLLHYQPQTACQGGSPTGVEALVRWQPPGAAMVSPARFIPLAEETGLIVPLGEWVLRSACAQAKAWLDAGLPPLTMAVNLSPRQFRQPDLVQRVAGILAETGLPAHLLELEITEGAIMEDAEGASRMLAQLKALGVVIAIDDFGTGYSSLAYLKRFAIDKLKIDQSFVQDIPAEADSMEIANSIIGLAKNLRLQVLAEGVETPEQLAFLQTHGCDACQGYLFSRPLPAAELAHWLAQQPQNRPTPSA